MFLFGKMVKYSIGYYVPNKKFWSLIRRGIRKNNKKVSNDELSHFYLKKVKIKNNFTTS